MPPSFLTSNSGSYGSSVPFQRTVDPAQLGMYLNLDQAEGLRMSRYAEAWRFYHGNHWTFTREDGEPLVTLNYYRKFIDKLAEFLVGKGFVITVPEVLEDTAKPYLEEVWEYNDQRQLLWDIAVTGGVTGDPFVLITDEEPSAMQRKVNPYSQGRTRINLLGSEQVFPTWDPLNVDTLTSVRIETIYYAGSEAGRGVDNNAGHGQTRRFSQIITPSQIIEQFHGEVPEIRENTLGEIPLVHIKNVSVPKEYYGLSDGQDLMDLNRELNEKSTDISDTINYHCVDGETEALTLDGWKAYDQLTAGDVLLCLDPESDTIRWQESQSINVFKHTGSLTYWSTAGIDALTTDSHRWLVERKIGRPENRRYSREFARTLSAEGGDRAIGGLPNGSKLVLGGGEPTHFPKKATWSDEFVATVGWWVTEGCVGYLPSGSPFSVLAQSRKANPGHVKSIRQLREYWLGLGETFGEDAERPSGVITWRLGTVLTQRLLRACPGKSLPPAFLCKLTYAQADLLHKVLLDADGTREGNGGPVWYQDDHGRVDGFQMLSSMLGIRTHYRANSRGNGLTSVLQRRYADAYLMPRNAESAKNSSGVVWCPTVPSGVWMARRNGYTYWTGNSSPITVITGAKVKNLDRGPKQIWSGLPAGAEVFNLALEGDLAAAHSYWKTIKTSMHELGDVPEGILGQTQPISNTSGVALHIQYQPILGRTKRKRATYEPGLQRINYFILRIGTITGRISLPFDLCKHCGGRILAFNSPDEFTHVWDEALQDYREVPKVVQKCFLVDKQTLEFQDPKKLKIKVWREYGFGGEVREVPIDEARGIADGVESYWDYAYVNAQEADDHAEQVRSIREQNQRLAAARSDENAMLGEDRPPEQLEEPKPPTPRVKKLPAAELDIPEEPETITVVEPLLHPVTHAVVREVVRSLDLVPTGCVRPRYLNPFENKVSLIDVLPKDEALQAKLYDMYLKMRVVDVPWVRSKIPEVAVDQQAIERRMKGAPLTEADPSSTHTDIAPDDPDPAAVPGGDGNPAAMDAKEES